MSHHPRQLTIRSMPSCRSSKKPASFRIATQPDTRSRAEYLHRHHRFPPNLCGNLLTARDPRRSIPDLFLRGTYPLDFPFPLITTTGVIRNYLFRPRLTASNCRPPRFYSRQPVAGRLPAALSADFTMSCWVCQRRLSPAPVRL
jgi:hypothetical protein